MHNIVKPVKAVSFEEALRNLAAKLTGQPASALPKTQEAIVQYMAENVPSLDEMVEAVTARIAAAQEEPSEGSEGAAEGDKSVKNTKPKASKA